MRKDKKVNVLRKHLNNIIVKENVLTSECILMPYEGPPSNYKGCSETGVIF